MLGDADFGEEVGLEVDHCLWCLVTIKFAQQGGRPLGDGGVGVRLVVAFAFLELGKDPKLRDAALDEKGVYLVLLVQRGESLGPADNLGESLEGILERRQFVHQLVSFFLYGHGIQMQTTILATSLCRSRQCHAGTGGLPVTRLEEKVANPVFHE